MYNHVVVAARCRLEQKAPEQLQQLVEQTYSVVQQVSNSATRCALSQNWPSASGTCFVMAALQVWSSALQTWEMAAIYPFRAVYMLTGKAESL
jgi:hypothetical protein